MNAPHFLIKHIGINTPNEVAAEKLAVLLCDLFQLPRGDENDKHIFAGSLFEVQKNADIGEHGHIALQAEDIEYAIAYFASRGIGIRDNTIRRKNGKIVFAYLDLNIGGFAVHLTY